MDYSTMQAINMAGIVLSLCGLGLALWALLA